ncbi:MAG: murein L,D-transpeptidase family protein [Desulfobulbaceae bacterium]|jgi:murein L,D-transpeptidase YafK|nr:murein L,D-transpeptidase family protein [Desulfobulbaceae bacterium]
MHCARRCLKPIAVLVLLAASFLAAHAAPAREDPSPAHKLQTVLKNSIPRLEEELAGQGFRLGLPVFIRIFKLPGKLEIWLADNGPYRLFKTYPICSYSGYLGPKLREGDWQSPEGFYSVTAERMNPRSSYHLSFNIGYPNEYDRGLGRDGGNIMVHGDCASMGCFAMNDGRIEEIYTLVLAALAAGQEPVPVHVFPFPLTDANLDKFRYSPWLGFWKNLKEGFDVFERTGRVPEIGIVDGRYAVIGTLGLAMSGESR